MRVVGPQFLGHTGRPCIADHLDVGKVCEELTQSFTHRRKIVDDEDRGGWLHAHGRIVASEHVPLYRVRLIAVIRAP